MNRRKFLKTSFAVAAVGSLTGEVVLADETEYFTRQNIFQAEPVTIGYWLEKAPEWGPADWCINYKHPMLSTPYLERKRRFYLYEHLAGYLQYDFKPRAYGEIIATERRYKEIRKLTCSENCMCHQLTYDKDEYWLVGPTTTEQTMFLPLTDDWRRFSPKRHPCTYCGSKYTLMFSHDDDKQPHGFSCKECNFRLRKR